MKTLFWLTASVFLVISLTSCAEKETTTSRVETLPFYTEATFTPKWIASSNNIDHQVPEFSLVNQLGDTITQDTFEDKIYITDFFFTFCSGICPKMTDNMEALEDEFSNDDDVLLLSHSVTPDHDTPEVLKEFADARDINPDKWHLVTGNRAEIYDLGRNAYFVEEDLGLEKSPEDFLHTENFVLVDRNRHIRGIYNGLSKTSIQQLIADVKTLQKE
jgi:protein SCO1/2